MFIYNQFFMNAKALGLTFGLFVGVCHFGWMIISLLTGYAKDIIIQFGSLHPGFSYTYGGALWMGILHFIMGFIVAYLFALVYNKLSK